MDALSPTPEQIAAAQPAVRNADVLAYYAQAPKAINLQVDQARETELRIQQVKQLIETELATAPDIQSNLYFHGTIDDA